MARNIFGIKKVTKEDKYTRKSSKYTDSEMRWEQFKIVIMIREWLKKTRSLRHDIYEVLMWIVVMTIIIHFIYSL